MMAAAEQHGGGRSLVDGRRVLVVGLGRTGQGVARWAERRGARVRLNDSSSSVVVPPDVARHERIDEPEAALEGIDLVVPSPGVPASSEILRAAQARGVAIVSEIEVAATILASPMVAVTGTNGKSTTTELIADMLRGSFKSVFAGGNLGTPLIEAVDGSYEVAVVEVSSFQLEWVDSFRPKVGVYLNVTGDHLDRHGDLETYAAVKARLFARQTKDDVAILNRDDPRVGSLASVVDSSVATFGSGRPAGDGASLDGDAIRALVRGRPGTYALSAFSLLGAHNRENAMAAVLAAMAMGASDDAIQSALDQFEALEHRMQEVHERGGVRFIDDSKATNVGALLRSLDGMSDGRVVLVAGGMAKGGGFAEARTMVGRKTRCAILYGSARNELAAAWGGVTPLSSVERFDEAIRRAADAAQPGDVVLLSPACASFDQFQSYAKRGYAFAQIVRSLG